MDNLDAITEASNTLDRAIQEYINEASDEPGIVLDWYLITEAHHDGIGRRLSVAESPTMTSWKREGLLRHLARVLYGIE